MSGRTSNSVITYTIQITMARCIPLRTDKAVFQHHGMDRMSQIAFPAILIKKRNTHLYVKVKKNKQRQLQALKKL